jgi:glycosyltransferase involved in cell wall biosynthesis
MKVLMLGRDDVNTVLGGDTIQMLQTGIELEKLGVQVHMGTVSKPLAFKDIDLIHVFNWEQLEPSLSSYAASLSGGTPIVLSTIFWYHTGHWYDDAANNRRSWRAVKFLLGAITSRAIYEKWQQVKFKRGKMGRNLRRLLSIPAQLLPNSYLEVEHLEYVLGLKGRLYQRCTVVPNGVNRELFDPLPAPNQHFYNEYGLDGFVLEVARIQSAKNQLGLIEALSDTSFPIVLLGQPSPYEKDYVDSCITAAKRRGNVYFVSPKNAQELAGIYRLAAVHVLPSWRETPGLVSLEAAAAGCRIVTTLNGSAREYFGDQAWYCNPRDPHSIRQAVFAALDSTQSNILRNRVLECFTWDVAAKVTYNSYHEVLGGS